MGVGLCLQVLCVLLVSVAAKPKNTPYRIDLDLPEEERWLKVAADYKSLVGRMNHIFGKLVPKRVLPLIEKIGSNLDGYLPKPYAGELRGIAKAVNGSLGELVLLNLIYDLTAHCTSILSQDSKGRIWHSRNLDYPMTETLQNVTIHVEFVRKNKVIYSGTTFAGYIGLLTGQRPHAFTISIDERDSDTPVWENALTLLLDKSAAMISFTVRQALEEDISFTQAVLRLAETDTIAPVYYIVGGVYPGQGAIVTRDRLQAVDTWFLDPDNGRWFIVETNYDHWKPAPHRDDRRDAAIKMMKDISQKNIDSAHLFKVMVTPPLGRDCTVYTTIMSAGQPEIFSTWVWPLNTTSSANKTKKHFHIRSFKNRFRYGVKDQLHDRL